MCSLAGVKGYGLAMLIDILTGVLSAGPSGPNVRKWRDNSVEANLVSVCVCVSFCNVLKILNSLYEQTHYFELNRMVPTILAWHVQLLRKKFCGVRSSKARFCAIFARSVNE